MEWGGFNSQEASTSHLYKKPASNYMFGPLVDAKASHPDTALTSLDYLQKSLTDMGMTYVHISVDLQLYTVACQINWHDVHRFKNVVLRPGLIHTVQSFCGCIGKHMRGSGVETLMSHEYGICGSGRNHEWQVLGSIDESFPDDFNCPSYVLPHHRPQDIPRVVQLP